MTKLVTGLRRWSRTLTRQLPDHGYPSDHPWRDRARSRAAKGLTQPRLLGSCGELDNR